MKFTIRNHAKVANKYIRFAKWKIRKLSSKFSNVLYSEIYVKKISDRPEIYETVVKLGVPGYDIVVSEKSKDLKKLWSNLSKKLKRQMRKHNEKIIAK